MPWSFFFSVWFQTEICLTNEYRFKNTIPNNIFYLSLFENIFLPNTLYLSPCLLCTLEAKPGLFGRLHSTISPCYAVSSEPWAVTSLIPGDPTRVPIRWTLSERGIKARRIFLSAFCLMMIAAPVGDVPWQRSTLMRLALVLLVLVRLFEKLGGWSRRRTWLR